ncbi:MAG: DNA polymerase III subunit alpha [Deltaproteobacteria bacterium]|nr:DNA polymerase III subunit alpha [Deltaproteobacteria bacterium]
MANSFVHLHLHTQYSLLDGAIKIPDLVRLAKEYEMPAVAMTDHGNLFGAIEFYNLAKGMNIKPILGCEVYVAPGSRLKKELPKGKGIEDPYYHLTVLCMNKKGYENLCRLITSANFEGFYYKPRIDKEILKEYHEGLLVLSGCLSSELSYYVAQRQEQKAKKLIEWYKQVFGDRFYFEIQENKLEEQKKLNRALKRYGEQYEIPLVATNDCHYPHEEDAMAHEVLLCIQTGKTLQDSDRMHFDSHEFYFKDAAAMAEAFREDPKACDITLEIAERCELNFELSKIYLPDFHLETSENLDVYLAKKAEGGLKTKLEKIFKKHSSTDEVRKTYEARLQDELAIIQKTGFAGYFLIVADFVNFAQQQGIPVGPGRGSAAGSLVAYCLNITNIDPIPHHLIFERFLNPERVSMPDMDIDFCMNRRDEVIAYVTKKYGKENVAQIITFGKLQAKAAIRDVGRAYGFSYAEVDRIAKLVPNVLNISLKEAIEQEPKLKQWYEKDERVGSLLKTALALEGSLRHASIHAAGIVISNRPLVEYMPLFCGKDGEIVTSFDMKHVEKIGLIKFDFLGLKTLTVLDNIIKVIRKTLDPHFDLNEIDVNDKNVYELFSKGDTAGIFQFESSGMRDLLGKLKPARFDDIIAANALFRPGPMMHLDNFIERRHGRVAVNYPLPQLAGILQDSYGIIVYQEQVMKIANVLANYTLGEADILRRAMGKKNVTEMAKQKERFMRGAKQNHLDEKKAGEIFDLMAKFAEYGFNKSHAQAYATIAFQTAYVKCYHRVLFMCETLTTEMENTDKLTRYIQDCKTAGIEILPPDVHSSAYEFTVVGQQIRFGLGAIKNVGQIAIEAILEARSRVKQFRSFSHFCESVDLRKVNRKVIESLIKAGALDSIQTHRARLMDALDETMEAACGIQGDREIGQENLFSIDGFSNTKKKDLPEALSVAEWPFMRKLRYEREATGLYISGHPLNHWKEQLTSLATRTTESLRQAPSKSEVKLGGVVRSLRETITRRGDKMAFAIVEDLQGSVDVVIFSDLYKKVFDRVHSEEPILVTGTVETVEDHSKIIAQQIDFISEIQKRKTSHVHIELASHELNQDTLESLKMVLGKHKGKCPVLVHVRERSNQSVITTLLRMGENFKVVPSEAFMIEIGKIFSRKVVRFE